jgi:hypothetical protein
MFRILFYFVMGLALVVLPWAPLWSQNIFASHYLWVGSIMHNNFVRGAVSGLGLADVWIAMYETWRLGSHAHPAQVRPPR